jgi:hypothetical protein
VGIGAAAVLDDVDQGAGDQALQGALMIAPAGRFIRWSLLRGRVR